LATFFKNHDDLFEEFRDVRSMLAERYAEHNPNYSGEIDPETGYPVGYSALSQDVLMGAFFTAYLSKDPSKSDIFSPFLKIPLPNWRINYNGLTKIKGMNRVFQTFTLNHNYTCSYNVGSYSTNIAYTQDANGFPTAYNTLGDFIPTSELSQIALTEQFSPLIGFDMTLKNSMLLKIEYKQSRNISLSFANTQITETTAKEVAVSAGYRFKDIKLGLVFSGVKRQFVSDLNLTAGFGLKDNKTMLRRINEDNEQVTSGMLNVTINVAADYQFSRMVGIKFYYDQAINRPKVQNQYNNMNFETGIQLQLMLSQ
jgi:cell surface protein SprA